MTPSDPFPQPDEPSTSPQPEIDPSGAPEESPMPAELPDDPAGRPYDA